MRNFHLDHLCRDTYVHAEAPGVYQAGHRGSIVGFTFESSDNGRQNAYYAPELELVVKRYRNLESDPAALKTFMDTQKAIAAQMMEVHTIYYHYLPLLTL